jgi:hypothetical protein
VSGKGPANSCRGWLHAGQPGLFDPKSVSASAAQDHRSFSNDLQLADISRPCIRSASLQRIAVDLANVLAGFFRVAFYEILHQHRNVSTMSCCVPRPRRFLAKTLREEPISISINRRMICRRSILRNSAWSEVRDSRSDLCNSASTHHHREDEGSKASDYCLSAVPARTRPAPVTIARSSFPWFNFGR